MKKLLLFTVILFAMVTQVFSSTYQGHFRWRNDDGSEATATWKSDEDLAASAEKNSNVRLRIELMREMDPGNPLLSLYYSTDSDPSVGTWTKITTDGATNHFILSSTDNYAQHDVAQDRLTNSYTHEWGFCNELYDQNTYAISGDRSMEVEFCLQPTTNAQLATAYYFSIRFSDTDLGIDGYYHVPSLTVTDIPLPVELRAFTATVQGSQVMLDWVTETELDNLGFLLQRKFAGQQEWQEIATWRTDNRLQGQGTTTTQTSYSFTDNPETPGDLYYRLANVHKDGTVEWHEAITVNVTSSLPQAFVLQPAYPNPFNPGTNIKYLLAQDSEVELTIFDLLGRRVRTLVNGIHQSAGTYQTVWDGSSDNGESLASGIYFVLMQTTEQRFMQRVTLVR